MSCWHDDHRVVW
jgi:hypothetical protein